MGNTPLRPARRGIKIKRRKNEKSIARRFSLNPTGQSSLRRSARIQVRIPVVITGTLDDGQAFKEETYIVTASKFGAKIKSRHALKVGMEIIITPKLKKESAPFRVVWTGRPGSLREGEAGIEYVKVSRLLGISFPD